MVGNGWVFVSGLYMIWGVCLVSMVGYREDRSWWGG
jgi:predicted membrane protein